jgi:hypothetical protein
MKKKYYKIIVCFAFMLLSVPASVWSRGTYMVPQDFLQLAFADVSPQVKKIWIRGELKAQVNAILGHDLNSLRVRYWERDNRTAWILEEIGKDKPVTLGIVIGQAQIERIEVLVFRESRGWEIRYPFFTDQFRGAALDSENALDRGIDGISGATLSVAAVIKVARLALLLHSAARQQGMD